MRAEITAGANITEAELFNRAFCMPYCFFPIESLYVEQSDCERIMNFNTVVLEVLGEETHLFAHDIKFTHIFAHANL